jgi:hypothetical protein
MPFCPNCRVSLAPDAAFCPLCRAPVVDSAEALRSAPKAAEPARAQKAWTETIHNADEEEILSAREKRIMVFELLSVSFGIMLAVTLCVDFLLLRGISWSRYTSLVLLMTYLCAAIPLILWGHPWLIYSVLGPSLFLFVFLWALFSGDFSWLLVPALPITVCFEGAVVTSLTLISVSRRHGLNVVGIVLVALAFLCATIDASIDMYRTGAVYLSWSVIVLVSLIPVAGFFFYLHYRVMKRASLRKLFRL